MKPDCGSGRRFAGATSAAQVSLGLVFHVAEIFPHARQTLEILRVHAPDSAARGCSSTGLIAEAQEIEGASGFVLALYFIAGAD